MADDPATPIIGVAGAGVTGTVVGARVAAAGCKVAVYDRSSAASMVLARRVGGVALAQFDDLRACDAVVLCTPTPQAEGLGSFLDDGVPVVSIGDDLDDVRTMLTLGSRARAGGAPLVLGAGMAPGLSGLLAAYLAPQLARVDELHVAIHGTAGPACARQHHDALGDTALGWHDGEWIEPPGGSGRDLVWFPVPVHAHDCYRAAIADPVLLQRAFPGVQRVTARVSATRRDRLTARLPMLTPPHASGDLGAVRVEARGAAADGSRVAIIAGVAGLTGDLAGATAAATVVQLATVGLPPGVHVLGDATTAALDVLHHATRMGVRVQEYTGVARATDW